MNFKEFKAAGHWPTLLAAFLYFDISFMIWYMLGLLSVFIGDELNLSATEKGLLVASPILGGAAFRIVWGTLVDYFGPRRAGLVGITVRLGYDANAHTLRCPWHRWEFDLQTGHAVIPMPLRLKTFPLRIIEDKVQIDLHGSAVEQ